MAEHLPFNRKETLPFLPVTGHIGLEQLLLGSKCELCIFTAHVLFLQAFLHHIELWP